MQNIRLTKENCKDIIELIQHNKFKCQDVQHIAYWNEVERNVNQLSASLISGTRTIEYYTPYTIIEE